MIGTLAALRIDLVGTTADFRRPGPRHPLSLNHLPGENRQTMGRIGEVRLIGAAEIKPLRLRAFGGLPVERHGLLIRAVVYSCTETAGRNTRSPQNHPHRPSPGAK